MFYKSMFYTSVSHKSMLRNILCWSRMRLGAEVCAALLLSSHTLLAQHGGHGAGGSVGGVLVCGGSDGLSIESATGVFSCSTGGVGVVTSGRTGTLSRRKASRYASPVPWTSHAEPAT